MRGRGRVKPPATLLKSVTEISEDLRDFMFKSKTKLESMQQLIEYLRGWNHRYRLYKSQGEHSIWVSIYGLGCAWQLYRLIFLAYFYVYHSDLRLVRKGKNCYKICL